VAGIHCPACHQGYINSLTPRCLGRCGRAQESWSATAPRLGKQLILEFYDSTGKGFPYHHRVSPKEAFKGPEPDDGKPSRPVRRGPAPSHGGWLLGSSERAMLQQSMSSGRCHPGDVIRALSHAGLSLLVAKSFILTVLTTCGMFSIQQLWSSSMSTLR
jgi:hypothetical protein